MKAHGPPPRFLVLSSRRAFETFTGPVPAALQERYVFRKPAQGARILAALPDVRLVISQSYLRPELNRWIFEARRRGVPTLLLVDGPLEWSNVYAHPSLSRPGAAAARGLFQPIVHDAVAAIGEAQARFIEGRNRARGIVFMSYANRRIRTGATPLPEDRPHGSSAPAATFDFLLTTARTPSFGERERAALTRALCACATALVSAGHRTLVRIFDEDIRGAVQAAAPAARFEATGPFRDALARCRCVIGTPSSVLLEAMHHDRPTATLVFRDSPLLYQTGWLLGGFADWQASFASMLAREPARMALQREVLRENVANADFFEQAEAIARDEWLTAPRPLDEQDLAFENQVLRHLAGWRAQLLAPLCRAVLHRSPPEP